MTYEELEILIKNLRTSERRAELVRAIPSEKEEAEGNDEHRQLELKKTTGELKDGMHSATWTTDGYFVTVTFKRPDYNASGIKDDTINDTKNNTKDCIKELSDRQYLILRFIILDDTITIDEMIQKMKVSPITVKRDLADLQAKGIIAREGGRKNGRWLILKPLE